MDKIWKVVISDNSPRGVRQKSPAITINQDKAKVISIPTQPWGVFLTSLTVRQVSGVSVAFDVEVVDSAIPFKAHADNNDEIPIASLPSLPSPAIYRVIPKQSVSAGNELQIFNPIGYTVSNTDTKGDTVQDTTIYIVIIPNGAVTQTKWELSCSFRRAF